MMARASRRRFPQASYRAPGGQGMILFIILFGVINAVAHVLTLLDLLPVFK
ncbi:Tryptophan-specific transport protein [compost metagenome]